MADLLSGKRIGLLTSSASRLGGGVFEAVVLQCGILRDLGAHPVVFALDDAYGAEDEHRLHPAEVQRVQVRGPAQIGYAPTLTKSLLQSRIDVLHLHGIWMYPSHAGAMFARTTGRPYAISPHGMLDPWIVGRGRWKKAIAKAGYERRNWTSASRFHALTPNEASDIKASVGNVATVVIPNAAPFVDADLTDDRSMPPPKYTYIGRIHAKKNIQALIDGWTLAQSNCDLSHDAMLSIAGWGDEQDVAALCARVDLAGPSVAFVGPVFGEAKAELLRSSRFVVLPSLSEGLPMAIVEAWAAGRPTVMTPNCNLPEGFDSGAAIECGCDAATIARALARADALEEGTWQAMRANALGLAAGLFSATRVRDAWGAFYTSLLTESSAR